MTDRVRQKVEREKQSDFDYDEVFRLSAETRAERSVQKENETMWAIYNMTKLTQSEVAELVIRRDEERPTQSQVSRIISDVDDEILFGRVEVLNGWKPFHEEATDWLQPESAALAKPAVAHAIAAGHLVVRLTSPFDDHFEIDELAGEEIDFDPMKVTARRVSNSDQNYYPSEMHESVVEYMRDDPYTVCPTE